MATTPASTSSISPTTVECYLAADRPLTDLLDAVPAERWSAPSPCEGWDAREVVRHLIDTQRHFMAERGVDLGDAPEVDADPAAAWRAHSAAVTGVLVDPAVASTAYEGYFGPTTVGDTLTRFYVFDMVAHRWDVARAVGAEATFSAAELDQLEAGVASFGDAVYMEGICAPGVEAPADADRQTRVLATLGRRA